MSKRYKWNLATKNEAAKSTERESKKKNKKETHSTEKRTQQPRLRLKKGKQNAR